MEYSFHIYNKLATDGITMALERLFAAYSTKNQTKTKGIGICSTQAPEGNTLPPVVVCIGSDLAIGDSLGPIVGSMLEYKTQGIHAFLYGTLASPITAREIKYLPAFLEKTHKGSPILAIDAAVGEKGDIGLIKLTNRPLLPGAGANKKLDAIGDLSIMGIVAEKSLSNYGLLNSTRLNLVYAMAEIISDGVANLLWNSAKGAKNA